jgi:hypothetical protein
VSNRIWLLDLNTGALVFLWDGVGADVNSSGMVVGSYGNGPAGAVVRSPSGDINVFPDLGSGLAVSESGDVLGFITVGVPIAHFAVRSGGMVTDIGVPTIEGNQPSWTILDFDDAHRVIVEATVYDPLGPPVNDDLYVTTPDQGWALISDITHGQGATPVGHRNSFESSGPISATFRDDGTIATYTGILTPVSDQSVWTLRPGSPIATVGGAEGDSIAGINVYNELVVIRNTLNGRTSVWTGRRLYVGALTPAAEIVAYTDPMDGDKEFVAVADTNFGRSFSVQGNSGIDLTPDLTHLTVFTTGDGVVVLVGVDPRAHLQMMFHGSFGPWTQVDLTETHFQPQGLPTPHFVSGFSAFVTPWGSDHFVGLDDQGHAEVVWWASGMTLWRVDDLTASVGSGAPTLTGRLTAFATPWGTLHVNGVDAQGEMTSIWWAPSFGSQWTASRLLPGGLALDPATLDSYVTAWGGLTISGIDRQGRIAVYWWSSESDGWHAEAIAVRPPPASLPALDITARPAARAVGSSSQAIAAAGADGHVLRYSWTVGDADLWNLTDITAQT